MHKTIFVPLLLFLSFGVTLLAISLPVPNQTIDIPYITDTGDAGSLQITIPRYLRLGDRADVSLMMNLAGGVKTAPEQSVKLKANLQSLTLKVAPSAAVTAVIPADGQAYFSWEVTPHTNGEQQATMWCFEVDSRGSELILARDINFEVKTFIGMKYGFLRWMLSGLILVGLIFIGMALIKIKRT